MWRCRNCGLVQVKAGGSNILIKDGQSSFERRKQYEKAAQIIKAKLSYSFEVEKLEEPYKEKNWIDRLRKIQKLKKTGWLLEVGGGITVKHRIFLLSYSLL